MVISTILILAEASTNVEAHSQYQNLQPYIFGAVMSIFTGIGGYIWGLRRDSKARVRQARDRFLEVLADQRAKFDALKWKEAEFFEQSVPAFTQAVYGIQPFIPVGDWECLHAVLRDYQSHHKSEFEGGSTRMIAAFNAQLGTGKNHADVLREYLDKFDDCINGDFKL